MAGESRCRHCGDTFLHSPVKPGTPPPRACGKFLCGALEHWTDDDWECQAHVALRRADAGVPASPLDREALRRFPTPRSWAEAWA